MLINKLNNKYMKLNVGGLKQKSDRHDYNTRQRSDLQSEFCITGDFNKVNSMEIKLSNNFTKPFKVLKITQLFKSKGKS
jgi:hypothetical protein